MDGKDTALGQSPVPDCSAMIDFPAGSGEVFTINNKCITKVYARRIRPKRASVAKTASSQEPVFGEIVLRRRDILSKQLPSKGNQC
jgi:hypothetical protein